MKIFLLYVLIGLFVILAACYLLINYLSENLPKLESLENIYQEQFLSSEIYSSGGVLLRTLEKEKRFWVTYDKIPRCMIDALLATEDQRFFKHWGFSLPDFMRALKVDIITRSFSQGGSTITQQLAKKLYLKPEKTITRKLREIITAVQIERTYSKNEIVEMYLNKMDFANELYGIQAAAQVYFGKNAAELTIPEAALLAGILNNPSRFNPRSQREERRTGALRRRNLVLKLMARTGKISPRAAREEIEKPIVLASRKGPVLGPAYHFTEQVREELVETYGNDLVMTGGLKINTTLDSRLQKIAEDSLKHQIAYLQENYADKLVHYVRPPGLSDEAAYDDSLKKTLVQGALIAIDVKTGAILAMIGGVGYQGENFFNRATMALRQPGSLFKPFVYTAALDNGWRCSDTILDSYVYYENTDGGGSIWEPQNFDKEFHGLLSLRDGFKESINVVAIKLMNDVENRGIGARTVVKYARKMGINTQLDPVLSLAIGTGHVKLAEMVSAYTIFPNLGEKTETFVIRDIYDKNNNIMFDQPNDQGAKNKVLDSGVASLMITMMKSVTQEGTASGTIKRMGMEDRPCAGKTGTGNEYKDAWFIGYTPYIACGVWVGFDSEETTLGGNLFGTGARAALPIWVGFIKEASAILGLPKDDFKLSSNITTLQLCSDSHEKVDNCPAASTYTEYFIKGTEITEYCHIHGSSINAVRGQRTTPKERSTTRRGF